MKNIFKYSPGFLAGVILSSAFAGAAAANSNLITNTIDELWVFVAGDPVLASQVNENFEYLESKIDEEVSFLSDDVIANTVSILNNEDGVGVNQSAISQVDSSLSSFQSSQLVRDGDQDVLIADNSSRITNLESGSGGSGMFVPSDLHSYEWDIAFTYESFSSYPILINSGPIYFGTVSGVVQVKDIDVTLNGAPFIFPARNEMKSHYTGLWTHYLDTGKSFNFSSDGVLVYLGWGVESPPGALLLSGVMSSQKDRIVGDYFVHFDQWNSSKQAGTFVATRL